MAGPVIDIEKLTKAQIGKVAEHYSGVVDILVNMNNTVITHLSERGLSADQVTDLNKWAEMVTSVLAASEFEVRRIIGDVPEWPIDPRKQH